MVPGSVFLEDGAFPTLWEKGWKFLALQELQSEAE